MAYDRPALTVDALVLCGQGADMMILVIERAQDPCRGRWALPGGFVEAYEAPSAAVGRELLEETGLQLPAARGTTLTLRARKGRDPRGWTVSQPYLFWLEGPVGVVAGDDAKRAEWVRLSELGPLAFDHGAILCEGLGRFWFDMPLARCAGAAGVKGFGVPERKIAAPLFFGGTFAPWHEGHRAAIETCTVRDRIVVVPDYNPFKDAPAVECFYQHYRHIQDEALLLGVPVFPGFCGIERPNPSYYWLRELESHPSLLLGADSFMALRRWTESDRLLKLLKEIHVAHRQVDDAALQEEARIMQGLAPSLRIFFQAHHPFEDRSGTALRSIGKVSL